MNDLNAHGVHALVLVLRRILNEAALPPPTSLGLSGDEVFAALMTVLVENIARAKEPTRSMLIETVIDNVKAAVAFEAGHERALNEIWAAMTAGETRQ